MHKIKKCIFAVAFRIATHLDVDINMVQYGLEHYPELDKEGHYERTLAHLHEKYGRNGYLKLWFTESPNAQRLEQLRQMMEDEVVLRKIFERCFEEEKRGADCDGL